MPATATDRAQWLLDLPRADQEEILLKLAPEERATLERQIIQAGEPWRQNPLRMMIHLEPDDWYLWDYSDLLADQFVLAIRGKQPNQMWMLPSQMGKGVDVMTPMATPTGWTTMGELVEGDEVFGGNGKPCRVTMAAPERLLDCYDVHLHDGAHLVADGDHLWPVWDSSGHDPQAWAASQSKGCWRTVDTRVVAMNPGRYRLPQSAGVTLPERDLPIHPYALGVWLGDGTSSSAGLTCADDEILDHLTAVGESARRIPTAHDPYRCTWAGSHRFPTTFRHRLRQLGVLGMKHVPKSYLWAGDKQRLELLQGLMDTDGTVSRNPTGYTGCEFTSTNDALAQAVKWLARSLGLRATIHEGRATLDGRDCGPKWRVTFTTEIPVFKLSRKAARLYDIPGHRRPNGRVGFKSVTSTVSRPTRCIQVDSPDSTYLIGKDLTVTHNTSLLIAGVVWALDDDPTKRIMYVSYDADRAVDEGGKARDLANKHADKLRFELRADQRARGKWTTTEGGGLYCVGVRGAITGFPEDIILADDMHKGWQDAHSKTNRDLVHNVYRSQVRMRVQSRLDPKIIAGTRWHEDDLQSRLLQTSLDDAEADQWVVVRLPARAEQPDGDATDLTLRLPDPLGRAPGEVIEPERFPIEEVKARAASLGGYLTASMEQQRPSPAAGDIIKREWWRIEDSLPPKFDQKVTSWDMKLKEKETGDFTVGQVWGRTGKDMWLIDQIRGQFDQPTTRAAFALMVVRHNVQRHWVEIGGYAPEIMDSLRTAAPNYVVSEDISGKLGMSPEERASVQHLLRRGIGGIIPIPAKASKEVRAVAASSSIEAGDVHLWAGSTFLGSFLEEMSSFGGGGGHDDQVDAMSQAIVRLRRRGHKARTFVQEQINTRASPTEGMR